jgi:hypothetical protein
MRLFSNFVAFPALLLLTLALLAFQPSDPADLTSVLTWLAGVGAVYAVGYGVSFILEKVPGWGSKLPSWARGVIVIALSAGVALGAQYLLGQAHFIGVFGPVFTLIVQMVVTYVGTQRAYDFQKTAGNLADRF